MFYVLVIALIPHNLSSNPNNLMSGGNWQKCNSRKKCIRIWLHTRRMNLSIEGIFLLLKRPFQNFMYKNSNSLKLSSPVHEAKEVKCNGATHEQQ